MAGEALYRGLASAGESLSDAITTGTRRRVAHTERMFWHTEAENRKEQDRARARQEHLAEIAAANKANKEIEEKKLLFNTNKALTANVLSEISGLRKNIGKVPGDDARLLEGELAKLNTELIIGRKVEPQDLGIIASSYDLANTWQRDQDAIKAQREAEYHNYRISNKGKGNSDHENDDDNKDIIDQRIKDAISNGDLVAENGKPVFVNGKPLTVKDAWENRERYKKTHDMMSSFERGERPEILDNVIKYDNLLNSDFIYSNEHRTQLLREKAKNRDSKVQEQSTILASKYLPSNPKREGNGSLSYQHNNPLNIKWNPKWMGEYGGAKGEKASDGGSFAKFDTIDSGLAAAERLIQSHYYNKTVDKTLMIWSNKGYNADSLGVSEYKNTKIKDLPDETLNMLMKKMIEMEGWVEAEGSNTVSSNSSSMEAPEWKSFADSLKKGAK